MNKEKIKKLFNNTSDLVLYEFKTKEDVKVLIAYIDGMRDTDLLNSDLIKPIKESLKENDGIISDIYISKCVEVSSLKESISPITEGGVIVFIEGLESSYIFNIGRWDKRNIEAASNETSIRGPQEAFIEDINVNKILIRRKEKA